MFNHPDEFMAYVRDHKMEVVDLKFVDLFGGWHHITLNADALGEKLFTRGVGFDGSSLPGYTTTESGDLVVVPDVKTAFLDPFWDEPILSAICWIREAGTTVPYSRDARYVLIKAMEYLKEQGIDLGFEEDKSVLSAYERLLDIRPSSGGWCAIGCRRILEERVKAERRRKRKRSA